MKSSPILLAFYKAWLGETKPGKYQRRNGGLCPNLVEFMDTVFPECRLSPVMEEMHQQFRDAGLNETHPFHADIFEYRGEVGRRSCHTNKVRIQWVQDRIKDMEETE